MLVCGTCCGGDAIQFNYELQLYFGFAPATAAMQCQWNSITSRGLCNICRLLGHLSCGLSIGRYGVRSKLVLRHWQRCPRRNTIRRPSAPTATIRHPSSLCYHVAHGKIALYSHYIATLNFIVYGAFIISYHMCFWLSVSVPAGGHHCFVWPDLQFARSEARPRRRKQTLLLWNMRAWHNKEEQPLAICRFVSRSALCDSNVISRFHVYLNFNRVPVKMFCLNCSEVPCLLEFHHDSQ